MLGDVLLLQVNILFVHPNGAVTTGEHGDIDVDSLARPMSQRSVAVNMKNKLTNPCQPDRSFNLVFDLPFGNRLAVLVRENEFGNIGQRGAGSSLGSVSSKTVRARSVNGAMFLAPFFFLSPSEIITPAVSSIMLSVNLSKSPSARQSYFCAMVDKKRDRCFRLALSSFG